MTAFSVTLSMALSFLRMSQTLHWALDTVHAYRGTIRLTGIPLRRWCRDRVAGGVRMSQANAARRGKTRRAQPVHFSLGEGGGHVKQKFCTIPHGAADPGRG